MKATISTICALLFGCMSFAQTTRSLEEITFWNTPITHPDGQVLPGTIAKTNGLITFAGELRLPVNPTQRTYTTSVQLADGVPLYEHDVPAIEIPGINNHSMIPVKVTGAGIGARILLSAYDAPPGTNISLTNKVKMHSYNPANNWQMSDYMFPMEDARPVDFVTVNGADIIVGNKNYDFVSSACGYSFFVIKSYTGYNTPVWSTSMNTTYGDIDHHTEERASSVYVEGETIFVAYDSYHVYDSTHHGMVARIQSSDGTLISYFDTQFSKIKKIVRQQGFNGELIVIGEKISGAGIYPTIGAVYNDSLLWEKSLPLFNTSVKNALPTSDGGFIIVGGQNCSGPFATPDPDGQGYIISDGENCTGYMAKLDKTGQLEWIMYTDFPLYDIIETGTDQYAFLMKDGAGVRIVLTKDLSESVGVTEPDNDKLRIAEDSGIIKIWGNFTEATVIDVMGKTIETISPTETAVSEFAKVTAAGVYLVDIMSDKEHLTQRVTIK